MSALPKYQSSIFNQQLYYTELIANALELLATIICGYTNLKSNQINEFLLKDGIFEFLSKVGAFTVNAVNIQIQLLTRCNASKFS